MDILIACVKADKRNEPIRAPSKQTTMAKTEPTTRDTAVAMLRAGTATVAEVAWLAKTSHQRVSYWVKRAGINVNECRELYLTKEWRANTERAPLPKHKRK